MAHGRRHLARVRKRGNTRSTRDTGLPVHSRNSQRRSWKRPPGLAESVH